MKIKPQHLKSFWNKKTILFVSLIALFGVSLGVVTAWLTANKNHLDYSFSGASVSCQMINSYNNAAVQNTDEVTAYIRVAVLLNYRFQIKDENGNTTGYGTLFPNPPVEGVDCTITYNLTDWVKGADGYYYHRKPVAPGANTAQLVTGFTNPINTPEGYELRVEYLCEGIQSDPDGLPAYQAWGATVENGEITGATEITWN